MSVRTDVINLNVTVNGDNARNQLNDLRKKAADVKNEMANLKKGTAEYIAKKQELAGLTQEIKNLTALRNSVTPFTAEWKKYDDQT